jgi:hypothetical protein
MSVVSFGSPEDYHRELARRAAEHQLAVYKQAQQVQRAPQVPQPPWGSFANDPLVTGFEMADGDFPPWSVPR